MSRYVAVELLKEVVLRYFEITQIDFQLLYTLQFLSSRFQKIKNVIINLFRIVML